MTDTTTPTGDPVTWFEIGTDDPAAARAFYGDIFGWTLDPQGPYTLVTTAAGPSPTGGIQDTSVPLPDGTPRSYAIPCVQVADVAATCAKVEAAGGKVLVPATQPPGGPTYAHVADPAGNHVGIWTPAG
jgi:predicted enzyme related to lactoylglutathione lyase